MPRVKRSNSSNTNRFLLPLLVLWSFKKIGDFPIFLIKSLLGSIQKTLAFIAEAFRVVFSIRLKPHKRKKIKKVPKWLLPTPFKVGALIVLLACLFFVYSLFLINIAHNLPSPELLNQDNGPLTSEFYDRNGKLLYRLYENRNRTLIKLSDLPPYLVNATVAIEDKNYWGHPGVDIVGMMRALISNSKGQDLQGGSTITQQLIKTTLLSPDRTWQRKVREIVLAFWSEKIFNKKQILEMYFNQVPYGGPAWGIEAAAETYFGKGAKDLSLGEAAYLAGLPASPTNYSPFGPHPELGRERQAEVLKRMVEDKYITQDQANDALAQNLAFKAPVTDIKAPHFVMYVRALLAQKYGEDTVSQGGLRVTTTLDLNTQAMAEQVVSEEVDKLANLNVSNGAAMVVDPRSGQILAMVGSKDYWDPKIGNFNVALALRQPGSSIKVVTYATAFKQGFSPGTSILDAPVAFTTPWETYAPVNYDSKFHGLVTMRTALGSSYNIPAVKTLAMVGIPNMIQTAHDMGITSFNEPQRYGLSLTLGGAEVRLIDMMSVYSTLSQLGVRHDINPILKITDSKGQVIEDDTNPEGTRVLSSGVGYLVTDILADNNARTPAFGPNSLLNIPGHVVAVKTGTTDNKRDNWTFGYTPDLAVGVWVGNNDNEPMNPQLSSGVTGAAPIWNRLMSNLLKDKPNLAFQRPADVVEGIINGRRDLVISNGTFSPTPGTLTLTDHTNLLPSPNPSLLINPAPSNP